jgi:hypothetical protein
MAGAALSAAAQAQSTTPYWKITPGMVAAHDTGIDSLIKQQTMDKASPWLGGLPDRYGLHNGGSVCSIILSFVVGLVRPDSRHYGSAQVQERLQLALGFLDRKLTPDGNLDLLITNFNSPPDSAFAMYALCPAVHLARQAKKPELEKAIAPLLLRMASAIARGGVHTPNHRWVMCAALAQAHALFPTPAWLKRVDDWLLEGIDIDADGQYSERSTSGYNTIVDRALTVIAVKLNRPELLRPVRRNLDSLLYLLHPGYEVVTEISKRQDQYTRGSVAGYWFALRTLAVRERNPVYETLARQGRPGVAELMEYPELTVAGPEPVPIPTNYEKPMPAVGIARVRRGETSATMMMGGSSRLFSLRRGGAVVNAVRFAGAFFGKGQFVPAHAERTAEGYVWTQSIESGYYQPFGDGTKQPVGVDVWYKMRDKRKRTEVCRIEYRAELKEQADGFQFRISAQGTKDLPVAIEINLAGEGELSACEPALDVADGFVLSTGKEAVWKVGADQVRFGPGRAEHQYTQVRGAEAKLPGRSVYLTGYAPFEHTMEFRW